MATKGERQALAFLTGVVLLGAATRACQAKRDDRPGPALDRQIAAVESSSVHGRGSARGRSSSPRPTVVVDTPAHAHAVDLDLASVADIERLPGVGPSLAKRIVADRVRNGAFGCLATLDSVKGIGPAMLRRLDSLVTFTGAPRPGCR